MKGKIVASNTVYEDAVKPLVTAMKVPEYREACRILFVNCNLLTFSKELGQLGVVSCSGPQTRIKETLAVISSDSQTGLAVTARQALPRLYGTIVDTAALSAPQMASAESEADREAAFVSAFMQRVASGKKAEEFMKPLMPYIGSGIKPFGELLVASLHRFYYDRFQNLRRVFADVTEVTQLLRRLGVLAPFLTISLCPECINYEFSFSRRVSITHNCPRCGLPWSVLAVDEFSPSFSYLKSRNKDLPVFISAYLKSNTYDPLSVLPNVEIVVGKKKIEVDVLVKETATGIECKCYEDPLVVSDNTIKSMAGELAKQIRDYARIGLERVVVITNLATGENTPRLAKEISTKLAGTLGREVRLEVLGSDMTQMHEFLEKESRKTSEAVHQNILTQLAARIEKKLKKEEEPPPYKNSD